MVVFHIYQMVVTFRECISAFVGFFKSVNLIFLHRIFQQTLIVTNTGMDVGCLGVDWFWVEELLLFGLPAFMF